MRDNQQLRAYWDSFYQKWDFPVPSQFAALTASELSSDATVFELGCGNGRDSLFFAMRGHPVVSYDASPVAIAKNRERAKFLELQSLSFEQLDVLDFDAHKHASLPAGGKLALYARFFLHAIDASRQLRILDQVGGGFASGSQLFLEYRELADKHLDKIHGDHERRYIDHQALVDDIQRRGFHVDYQIRSQGLAKYKTEDPFVGRIIATKL